MALPGEAPARLFGTTSLRAMRPFTMRSELLRSRIVRTLLGLALGLFLAETGVRAANLRPPTQIIRGTGLRVLDDVPVWGEMLDRENSECPTKHPDRIKVLFLGSSITFGSGVAPDETFTHLVERELNQQRPTPGFCVLNFAQPAFSFEQKMAVGKQAAERYKPALILWESWVEWMDFAMIGDAAYGVSGFALRPDGAVGVAGVPTWLNGWLFRHSRAYEYLALTEGERIWDSDRDKIKSFVDVRLPQVPVLAASVGAKLIILPAPPLHAPFSETAASPPEWHTREVEFGKTNNIPVHPLQNILINEDYLALRDDPCCHYNPAGHAALAPSLTSIILDNL